jgi:BirA family biotin operon repressor/biotin-[acetyl-CoA-carboxylase] ligase
MKEQDSSSLFIGKVQIRLDSVDSTNKFAKELLSKTTPSEGTVIRTDKQFAGRGQFGSNWASGEGKNITLSVILYPKFLLAVQQFYLSMAVSLSVLEIIKSILKDKEVKIKWPNDIYVNRKKIAGILIENTLNGIYLKESVIGIGINVNQEYFSSELPNASSIFLEMDQKIDLDQISLQLYISIERHYMELKSSKLLELMYNYQKNLFLKGQLGNYQLIKSGEIIQGIIEGVDESGQLIMNIEEKVQKFSLKQISFLL